MALCTVAQATAELKSTDTSGTAPTVNTAVMLSYIGVLTQRIREVGATYWEPWYDTNYYTASSENVNYYAGTLTFTDMLLEPTSILTETTTLTYNTQVLPYPRNQYPIRALRLDRTVSPVLSWYPLGQQRFETIAITGFWGFREQYPTQGFVTSTDSIQDVGGITDVTQTIHVTSVTGADYYGVTPRFSPGNLIRLENELCEVRAVDAALNTLTVTRGARGTTASAHAQATTIKIWYPQPDLVGACARSVAMRYTRRGAYDTITVQGMAAVQYPHDLLSEVYDVISGYNNR